MTKENGDLFPESARPRGRSRAPETLNAAQLKKLHAWAENTVPWVSRGAFESFTTLESHVEETLEWWRGSGGLKLDWLATVKNRIRTVERGRLEKLARAGNDGVALALRSPDEWARRYDRKQRAVQAASGGTGGGDLIRPSGGGRVLKLTPPPGDRR